MDPKDVGVRGPLLAYLHLIFTPPLLGPVALPAPSLV